MCMFYIIHSYNNAAAIIILYLYETAAITRLYIRETLVITCCMIDGVW